MKRFLGLVAGLALISAAAVFAVDASPTPAPTPEPLGITVGMELGLGNLNTLKLNTNPASLGYGFTVDALHSVGSLDLELFFQRNALLTPLAGQGTAFYPWFAAAIYWEADARFNIKLGDTATLTPGISFQDNIFQSSGTFTTNNAPYGAFATNGSLQDMFAIETTLALTVGPLAIKLADNMTAAVDTGDGNVSPIHELYLQPTVTLGDLSFYVRGDFQPYIAKMTWLKWGVSKGLPFAPGLSVYTYGSWNFFNTQNAYSAFNFYNQALGLSLAF